MVAAQFKNLTSEERAKWDEKAKADKKRYEEEMANYSAPEDSDNDETEQTKKKAKKDKNAPKSARSAYTYFGNDMRESIKAENADVSFAEVNKMLGERWKNLSSDEKQKYEDMAAEDKKRYKKEMASYTPPEGSEGKTKKKAKKDPNAPKKAATSFFIFSSEMRPKLKAENPDIKFGELGKKLGELFRNLSPEEKERYEQKASEDKARFKKEMEEYKRSKKSEDDGVPSDDDSENDDDDDEED